jgi:DNA-binding MarR family transcriptional regulator
MSDSLEAIDRAMSRVRRSQTQRGLARMAQEQACGWHHLSLVPVLEALEEGPGPDGLEVTVGLVAERLGLDPSRASRMVTAAIQEGFVARVASQADGRRIHLELTENGQVFAAETHRHRQLFLGRVLAEWPEADLAEFARLLSRFATDLGTAQTL